MKSQKLIHVVSPEDNSIEFSKVLSDVTGGMRRKVTEAFKIAALGIDVLMINGLKPDRIIDAVMDRNFVGTRVSSNKRRSVPYFV
jgi:isopentenyl phosphate kinase